MQTARDAANRRDDPTIAAVSSAATQAQLSRLSRIQPNGRIALELSPETRTIDALPDLPLEHGDRITVPPRPGFVTVAGAVVNNNAFVWNPGRTAGDYLRLAGADEAADTSNMFILRADGTVNSASDQRGFFGRGGLESQVLQPGDALVVPNQLDFETWGRAFVRNLKDFAQIISRLRHRHRRDPFVEQLSHAERRLDHAAGGHASALRERRGRTGLARQPGRHPDLARREEEADRHRDARGGAPSR